MPRWDDLETRFWSKVDKGDGTGCWLWTGPVRRGYGAITIRGRVLGAHRYSAMLAFGMFDRRAMTLHRCDTPLCVRPEHLYLGSHRDNMADMSRKRTHCVHGHEFTPENTYEWRGHRGCRSCNRRYKALAKGGGGDE